MSIEIDVAAAFRDGTRFLPEGRAPFHVRMRSAGKLKVTSGHITCCDPLSAYQLAPLARAVPNGEHEVTLSVADFGEDQRVAAARVTLAPGTPVRWEIAARDGEDVESLPPGQIFGYGVDAGTGCFADGVAAASLAGEELRERITEEIERTYRSTWSWANLDISDDGANVAAFSTGWGDGMYPSWWGLDAKGAPLCLVTDFGVLTEPVVHRAFIERPFAHPMGPIACPELEPFGMRVARVETPENAGDPGPTLSFDSSLSFDVELVDAAGARVPVGTSSGGQPRTVTWQPQRGQSIPADARVRIDLVEKLRAMKSEA